MRVATSTNIISYNRGGNRIPMVEFIPFLATSGFTVLDLNFCEMMNPWSELLGSGWRDYVRQLAELKGKYALVYNQSHAPYTHDRFVMDSAVGAELDSQIERTIHIAGELGIPWVVLHAATDFTAGGETCSLQRNLDWIGRFVETATQVGTGIALENLDFGKTGRPEFTSRISDLVRLVDAFDRPNVAACYDFGHAHLTGAYHKENLKALGDRLACLHVADNHGLNDEHLLPFYGTVPWELCMETLADIGYQGDLTYEVMFFTQYLPEGLKGSFLRHAQDVGNYLVELFDSANSG
ncbi:MAG: hypothetical protein CVV48_11100 [Spirochaetae bacterium HGW-Spirochaetae-4]|nr:MAG: hypothetical protein A2Y31_08405 [Spirochaetes bacterium GWC2_52_13]OHD67073.1 MAG: hypothetical protein A2101_00505 [Spirochaetes bacterium GWF2_52_7]PKL20801.1 MAG: hypothetical protein CVV48_11100 [Spirochaetae bacterium HGW-Spirochaetae-4]HCG63946.1 hypothetical protein [Sphaerochaeta sp.]HCS37724.1 hypothetical protein [Sphaerochaeta sp.]